MQSSRIHPAILGMAMIAPLCAPLAAPCAESGALLPGPAPGRAAAMVSGSTFTLSNKAIEARWTVENGSLRPLTLLNSRDGSALPASPEVFSLVLKDGTVVKASSLSVSAEPAAAPLRANRNASRLSERFGGREITVGLRDKARGIDFTWRGILRDGSNYLRQEVSVRPTQGDLALTNLTLVDGDFPGAKVVGTVGGSPVVAGSLFIGLEHPMSASLVKDGHTTCSLPKDLPVKSGQSFTASSVVLLAPEGQMRRAVNYYLERERAHPYRTFLHYNSFYDIGYFNMFGEKEALDVVNVFGHELHEKRGVTLDSYLFDDGWDDPNSLWGFNSGFPQGFTPVRQATRKYGAGTGVWVSPWGGYGKPHDERVKFGKANGFETNADGFSLSGPTYYKRFRDMCLNMIREYGVNQFKIDGTGDTASVTPGSEFASDFEAAIHLISEMRTEKPDIFVNITTGTWPSPFWLVYADTIWRGGWDDSTIGVGSNRQQWITYRDADTYERIVQGGPLFPLTSLMLHGIIYAKHNGKLRTDRGRDFADEVHSYFGTGTQLQEMYITPALLRPEDWDVLAESAKWSRANADVLVDTHWVGGDPAKLQVYGWASWTPHKAVLTLRNPSDKPQEFALDVSKAFELPNGAPAVYSGRSPWAADAEKEPIVLRAGEPHAFLLAPFQVVNLDIVPSR
ncbi:MAG TPA: enterotoxin [Armatimonadota bacterium]